MNCVIECLLRMIENIWTVVGPRAIKTPLGQLLINPYTEPLSHSLSALSFSSEAQWQIFRLLEVLVCIESPANPPDPNTRVAHMLTSDAVARIAYIASDVVVSVQPSLAVDSEFSKDLRSFAETKATSSVAKGAAEVC